MPAHAYDSLAASLQLMLVLVALLRAPWRQLLAVPTRLHLLFGVIAGLVLLQVTQLPLNGTPALHLLGLTTATLVLGPALALLCGTAAVALWTLTHGTDGSQALVAALLSASVPVMASTLLLQLALRYGPRNPYFYFLGVAFAGGALSMLMHLLLRDGRYALAHPAVLALLAYAEGFLNGALVTVLSVTAPQWLKTYDEQLYERRR